MEHTHLGGRRNIHSGLITLRIADLKAALQMKTVMDRYGVKVGCIGSGLGKCSLTDKEESVC